MEQHTISSDTVTFIGTGGARFMVISQLLASGGIWLNLGGTELLVDPGPGCIVQVAKRKLKAEHLSAIILSHRHLDHSADVNIMVEAMTQGGLRKQGKLFLPADALDVDPVIFSYLRKRLESIEVLEEGKSYSIGDISFTTPIRHVHAVETYGMVFRTPRHTFSYIADTRYFDALPTHYGGELVIMNVVFLDPLPPVDRHLSIPIEHLSVPDAERLVTALHPRLAILTHFGMSMWRAKPWRIARKLTRQTGVHVVAARDGMTFDLASLDGNPDQQ